METKKPKFWQKKEYASGAFAGYGLCVMASALNVYINHEGSLWGAIATGAFGAGLILTSNLFGKYTSDNLFNKK